MKAQMRVQKYICLAMLLVGVLGLLYAFFYLSGAMSELGQSFSTVGTTKESAFKAAEGKYDAELFNDIQGFNNVLMICGIVMILTAVLLYITSCNKRRNYYVSNYVAIGLCAGSNIVMSVVLMALNATWRAKFLNIDFASWKVSNDFYVLVGMPDAVHYSESTLWFDLGFVVYPIIIIASVLLVLNLVWKIKLMQGEKKLLAGNGLAGGKAV